MLSKFTTQSVGTPSVSGVSSSSDTSPRRVRVSAATTTDPIRSATGSRVSTRTGRSPLGVEANQISPRRICPVRPLLGWSPVGDLTQGSFAVVERLCDPGLGVVLALQTVQVASERLPQQFRSPYAEPLGPVCEPARRTRRPPGSSTLSYADYNLYDNAGPANGARSSCERPGRRAHEQAAGGKANAPGRYWRHGLPDRQPR